MTSARATKLTFAILPTAILIAVMAALLFATPNSALAAGPDRPTDLVATAVDHDTVSLSWSHPDPTTVDHYQVLSRTVGAGTRLLQVGTSTTTSFEHDGLEPESTYVYRVKPVNSGGEEGRRSARAEATTPAEDTPAPAPEPDPTPVPDPTPAGPERSDQQNTRGSHATAHVSNIGQTSNTGTINISSSISHAQGFTTGSQSGGYTLSTVGMQFADGSVTANELVIAIYSAAAGGGPDSAVYTLTNPSRLENDGTTESLFTAPANSTLSADTTYFVVATTGISNNYSVQGTSETDEDSGASTGWNIANNRYFRNTAFSNNWSTSAPKIKIAIYPPSTTTLSTDATLSTLTVNDGTNDLTLTPTFAPGTTTYTAQVVNSVDEITITPTVNDTTTPATYEVQNNAGTALTDADTNTTGFQVALSVGANIIKVEVEAEDASTETYTVTVTRAMAATPIYEVLVSNTGQASADFATNAVDYGQAFTTGSDTAGYTLEAIDIGYNDSSNTAFSASIWSTYALDKAPNAVLYSLTPPATFSPGNLTFTAPPNTTLTSGTTYIIMLALDSAGGATVKRTATVNPDEDAGAAAGWSIANNYIFAISGGWGQNGAFGPLLIAVKGTVYAGSNDATLSALTVNDGTNDLTLTPTFVSGTYAYEADVGNAVTTVTLSDTLNDDTAEITGVTLGGTAIADTDLTDGITVPSLLVGDNEIVVTVTAEDASTQTYTVTVTRAATDVVPNATGKPGITGAAQVGMTLTAGTADIMDADGLTAPGYTYQWLQEGSDISGQTSSTYTPTSSDIGKNIKVKVEFTDDDNNAESLTSDETTAVVPAAITCPTDTTWCSILTTGYQTPNSDDEFLLGLGTTVGTPSESFGSLDDATFTHLGLSYTVTQILVDSVGGSSLFATSPNLPDDGAGLTLSVQQVSGQRDIPLAGNAYQTVPYLPATTKTWQFVHALNSSVADPLTTPLLHGPDRNYDPYHHHTNKDTEVTIWLTFANRTAAGAPAIRGTAQVGETLTAGIGDIADVDGLPTTFPGDYTFQWLRVDADGVSNQTLIGTDATTYTPVAADTGKKIKVQVTFTDGGGTAETLTSVAYPSSGTVLAATRTVSISADKTTAVYREDTITYTLTRTGSTTAALPVSVTLTQTKNFLLATALSKTVTIPAGQTTETFTVAALSFQHFATGTAVEAGTLTATVQDGTDYDLGTSPSVAVNIVIGPMIRIEHASYSVNEADGPLIVQVIARTGPGAPQPTANSSGVDIFFEDVTAIENTDYSTIQGNNFLFETGGFSMDGTEWQAEKTYIISVTNDDIDEDDETFLLNLKYVHNIFGKNMIVDASGNACDSVDGCEVTVTITDDDTAGVTVSKSAVTVTEQDTTGDTYTVVLDSQPTANVTITIGGQTAADITAAPTPLTFTTTNWATAQTVTVTAANDTDTVTDTHSLTHSAMSSDTKYSGISIPNVGVTVNDDDSAIPALSFDNINITVDEDDSQATLTVELSQASADTVTVDYATSDNTAEAGDDYTETSGTLTFTAGETVMAIIVPILDDAIYETLERFNVTLSNPTGATLPAFPGAQINIAVDESPPTASIANVTVRENAGTMTLTLNLSHESSRSTPYRTQTSYIGGTATQGADYENFLSGGEARITVPTGDTQASLDITITDDTAAESSETITIRWDNDPTGGNNGDATPATINFTGTITDNDSADDSATGKPGITGTAQVGMTLTAGTADIMDTDGLNTPGYTYQWLRAGSNISGATSNTYTLTSSDYGETIQVKVDFTDDGSNAESLTSAETLPVAPVAATCPTDTDTVWCATLTVGHSLDSDGDPSGSGFEARSGRTAFGSLSDATFTHLGVNYTVKTVWGGGRNDLVFSTTPNLPLDGAGLTLHVQVYDGELDAPLADASFNSSDHWFFGTALYVDSAGQLSNVPLIRGQYSSGARVQAPPDIGTKVMVRLSINLTVPTAPRNLEATAIGNSRINLSWNAPDSNGGSAITGYKIEVSNNGRNNWTTRVANTGSSNRTHSHTGLSAGDTRHYRVSAINASGIGPHSNVARATTGLPTVSISDATTTEGGDIVFVITISPTIDGFLSVSYGTGIESLPPGSMGAKKDDDYVPHHPAGANVQIGYGQSSVELTFTTVDDDLVEGAEIFAIGLYPSAYEGRDFSYAKRTAIATIRDDENGGQAYQDSVPGDTSTNRSISAGGSVTNRIETVDDADWYRATLTKNQCYQIKVEGSTADETLTLQYPAVRGVYRSDGTHILNTYENAGGRGATAISNVKLDTTGTYYVAAGLYRFENGGTFRMTLTDLGASDDSCGAAKPGGPMQISVADASMSEAFDHRKYMSFIVTLDRGADTEVTVNYTTVNGAATAGQDYEATSGTLVFDQGDMQKTVYVPIEYDSHDEDDETLELWLSNLRGAEFEDGIATGTIVDYD